MSIGRTLAEARERTGLSVEEVVAATRIRRPLVEGIEQDDFSACGGDVYARGHVRTLAKVVGLDAQPLLDEFDAARPDSAAPLATTMLESVTAARPERRGPNWSAAMGAALVLVLAYGAAQVLTSGGTDRTVSGQPGGSRGSATPSISAPAPSPSSSGDSSAVAQAPRDRVTVAVRARGTSWLLVTTASGEELFQGLLENRSMTFTDRSRVQLVFGNAGAVSLTVNGTAIGAPGKPGQVVRVQFSPQDPTAG